MKSGKAFLGILAGLAAGTVLGLIFAPAKGSHARKRISKKGEALVETLEKSIDEKFDSITGRITRDLKTKNGGDALPSRKPETAE